ncbi:MAG TPA: DUF962 domain-containing protein [Polyangiaceae bacterium]|jgi:uncharacterized membrane protein YGL010W
MSEQKMTFHDYMRQYGEDHQNPINKVCHMIGIPMIVASLPVIPFSPPVGLGMFGTGWGFQFVGHFFEGKKPSFTRDLKYLAIGPVWVTVEWIELLTKKRVYTVREKARPVGANGTHAAQPA